MKLQIDDLGVCGIVVDDWDITKSFKPKTITTDYTSWITYISRRAVPANTPITNPYYWKPILRLDREIAIDYNNFKDEIVKQISELDILVKTFLKTSGGTALDNKFGNREDITVNQKVITDAFNKIWTKFEDITGEPYTGINMTVTPDYFISEEGCTVHVTARATEANGIFEKIQLYINGTLVTEDENKDYFETDIEITETSVLKCVAKIMGIEYERQKVITHYNSFWLGAGNVYSDIMDVEHIIPITNGMRGAYDVHVEEGQKIIIIVGESLADGFLRADLNSVEIPFTESTVTIDDKNYKVFVSESWVAGDYNIDINR